MNACQPRQPLGTPLNTARLLLSHLLGVRNWHAGEPAFREPAEEVTPRVLLQIGTAKGQPEKSDASFSTFPRPTQGFQVPVVARRQA